VWQPQKAMLSILPASCVSSDVARFQSYKKKEETRSQHTSLSGMLPTVKAIVHAHAAHSTSWSTLSVYAASSHKTHNLTCMMPAPHGLRTLPFNAAAYHWHSILQLVPAPKQQLKRGSILPPWIRALANKLVHFAHIVPSH